MPLILMCIFQVPDCVFKPNKMNGNDQCLRVCWVTHTYVALDLVSIPRVLETQGIRQVCVVVQRLFVVDIGGHILGHLCGSDADHIPRGMVTGFGVLVVFLVFSV